jgi:pimeloyl-ACP methyl ester carboxylesterase
MRLSSVAYAERKSVLPKNIFLAVLYILILVTVAIGIVSFVSAWGITHPKKVTTPQITSNIAPDYKNISFTCSESKETLNGWFFPYSGSKKTVLMVHGYGKNRLQFDEETFKLITRLNNEGFNVMTFDLRGSGNSSGSMYTFGKNETQDVLSAIKYLNQQQTEQIVLMGFSSGASSCLSAVNQTPYRDSVIGVVADSPYATIDGQVSSMVSSALWLPDIPFKPIVEFIVRKLTKVDNTMDIIPQVSSIIPTPVLLIDGAQESPSPYSNTKLLYELYFRKSPVPAHYWNSDAKEYGMSYLEAQNEYMNHVVEFSNECVDDANAKLEPQK